MQIIINRIAIVVDDWRLIRKMKVGASFLIIQLRELTRDGVGYCACDVRVSISKTKFVMIINIRYSTCINIAVFIIWIPSHLVPPPIPV